MVICLFWKALDGNFFTCSERSRVTPKVVFRIFGQNLGETQPPMPAALVLYSNDDKKHQKD